MAFKESIRAGLYLRISEDRTGEGLGVARQRVDCLALCERLGWSVVEEFSDNDVSAFSGARRPQYERMIEAIRAGAINAVVVWDLDRLTRRTIELETFVELADEHGLQLASVGGDVDLSTDNGRLYARIKAAVARAEVERKSARQRAAARQAIAAGKHTGGLRAFGYTEDGLHLDPAEAPLIAQMFDRWNGGATLGEIARWLNAEGVKTVRGNAWKASTVRQALRNPRFAGIRGQRKVITDERGRPMLSEGGRWPRRASTYTTDGVKAEWPAIVTEAAWRAAVERLAAPERRTHYSGRERKYLLPGLARCGYIDPASGDRCGRRLKTGSNNGGMRVLKCATLRHVNRRADVIEDYALKVIMARLRRQDAARLLLPRPDGQDLEALKAEAEAIQARRRQQNRRYAAGLVSDAEYDDLLAETGRRLTEIDAAVATVGRVDVVARIIADPRDPAEVWEDLSLSEKRSIVDALMEVWVLPGRLGRPRGGVIDPATVDLVWRRALIT